MEQAWSEAQLTKQQLSEVEIFGGFSRINILKRSLGEVFGLDPTAMNYGLKTTIHFVGGKNCFFQREGSSGGSYCGSVVEQCALSLSVP